MDKLLIILSIVTGVYEVIARVIPSVNDWTVVGNVIRILKYVSDALNHGVKK